MVHKNYKWNISKIKGQNIANEIIKEIISEQKGNSIEINELIFLLNSRTKVYEIKNNKKKKNIVNFLKNNFGSLKKFLEENNYLIQELDNKIIVSQNYCGKNSEKDNENENNIYLNDWVFVDELSE